jgi:hypothetical protein
VTRVEQVLLAVPRRWTKRVCTNETELDVYFVLSNPKNCN